MHRMRTAVVALSTIALVVALGAGAGVAGNAEAATVDRSSALVELRGAPLTVAITTEAAPGRKIDFQSKVVRTRRAELSRVRTSFERWLRVHAPEARVTSTYDTAVHAVAVDLNGTELDLVRSAPQVLRAHHQARYTPQAHDDPDLALISAFQAWGAVSPGTPENAGDGVKIAIIDTGIDVRHPCFSDVGYPEG